MENGPQSSRTRSGLIGYCQRALLQELQYRLGYLECEAYGKKLVDSLGVEMYSEEYRQLLNQFLEENYEFFEGYQIEARIINEEIELFESLDNYPTLPKVIPNLIHHRRSVFGKTRSRTLDEFYELGFLNKLDHEEGLRLVFDQTIKNELEVLEFVGKKVHYYETFEEKKDRQDRLIQNLANAQVIDSLSLRKIKVDPRFSGIVNPIDLFPFCKMAKVFPVHRAFDSVTREYQQLFSEINETFFNWSIDELSITIVPNGSPQGEELELSLFIDCQIDGKTYQNQHFFGYVKPNWTPKDSMDLDYKIIPDFNAIFNKRLRDLNSKERLYYANDYSETAVFGKSRFGLLLMTQKVFELWQAEDYPYFLSKENHSSFLTTGNIHQMMASFRSKGLLNHLEEAQIKTITKGIYQENIRSIAHLLSFFPNTIVEVGLEIGNITNPYEALALEFSKASKGAFVPQDIIDGFSSRSKENQSYFQFTLNNKIYKQNLKVHGDWMDTDFFQLIDLALEESPYLNLGLYLIYEQGSFLGFMLLDLDQFKYLQSLQQGFIEPFKKR